MLSLLAHRAIRGFLPLLTLPILAGCVTGMYHDRQSTNPNYFQGRANPVIYPQLWQASRDAAAEVANPNAPQAGLDTAAMSLLSSAFSFVNNPDYYKKSSIGGRCIVQDATESGLELPCVNVVVTLTDGSHKELDSFNSLNGDFIFYVEKNREYGLKVTSDRYEMVTPWVGPVVMGDDVVLRLGHKKHAVLDR